ncbi:hypothetical protein [Sorangium sp. So ce131]|uniref:hypothetical protein n=1 Tax=Sorangium sp. So ce131 TaxID=3133282 RepID=UPI003F60E5D3
MIVFVIVIVIVIDRIVSRRALVELGAVERETAQSCTITITITGDEDGGRKTEDDRRKTTDDRRKAYDARRPCSMTDRIPPLVRLLEHLGINHPHIETISFSRLVEKLAAHENARSSPRVRRVESDSDAVLRQAILSYDVAQRRCAQTTPLDVFCFVRDEMNHRSVNALTIAARRVIAWCNFNILSFIVALNKRRSL